MDTPYIFPNPGSDVPPKMVKKVVATRSGPNTWPTLCLDTWIPGEVVPPDFMDSEEGKVLSPCPHGCWWHLGRGAELWGLGHPLHRQEAVVAGAVLRGWRCPPWGAVVWGLPGGRGQAGDSRGSREDLGHHLVASLTAFPKSPTRRVTVLRGQGLKAHQVLPGDRPAGQRDPYPWPRLAHPLGTAGWDCGPK